MEIKFRSIGTIHSPFNDLADMPIQPNGEASAPGTIEIYPDFSAGLKDLQDFSHLILLYHLHKVNQMQLIVVPFMDSEPLWRVRHTCTGAPKSYRPVGRSVA